jgi:hypothetical protein
MAINIVRLNDSSYQIRVTPPGRQRRTYISVVLHRMDHARALQTAITQAVPLAALHLTRDQLMYYPPTKHNTTGKRGVSEGRNTATRKQGKKTIDYYQVSFTFYEGDSLKSGTLRFYTQSLGSDRAKDAAFTARRDYELAKAAGNENILPWKQRWNAWKKRPDGPFPVGEYRHTTPAEDQWTQEHADTVRNVIREFLKDNGYNLDRLGYSKDPQTGEKINWAPVLPYLKTHSSGWIQQKFGVSSATVFYKRKREGIPAPYARERRKQQDKTPKIKNPRQQPKERNPARTLTPVQLEFLTYAEITWDTYDAKLATKPDAELAREIGTTVGIVRQRRSELGLPRFSAKRNT